ncbi:hypothetical protein FACS1894124_5790 [Spirochaetia bacterium]|nr:hypothetical protein FACS1894124_5790 [Spirochaetia bacterium]
MNKWLTDLTVEELRARIAPKPYKPVEIDGIPIFKNMDAQLLPKEVFKKHPQHNVDVSNLGRIRYNGAILLQMPDAAKEDDPYGYLRIASIRGVIESGLVYRLVAETWCDRPDQNIYNTVHHISNNGTDNRAENLLWVTREQHAEIHQISKA